MHEVLVNRLGGLSLPRKSVVRLTDRPDMTLDVYRGRKATMQQQQTLLDIPVKLSEECSGTKQSFGGPTFHCHAYMILRILKKDKDADAYLKGITIYRIYPAIRRVFVLLE